MKKILFVFALLFAILACTQSTPPTAESPTSSPTLIPTELPTSTALPAEPTATLPTTATPFPGTRVSFGNVTLVIPPGLANGLSGLQQPAILNDQQGAPWELTPGHTQLTLEGYALQDKFHTPQLFIYPADAYTELIPPAASNLLFLRGLAAQPETPLTPEILPGIPFFNAAQVFASAIQPLGFQNGMGVRFLTEYAQYFAIINNTDLFYEYQGLTTDGKYYVIAILPVTSPLLPAGPDPASTVPDGGIIHPQFDDPNADWGTYYADATNLLNGTSPDSFAPTLAQLDALISSLQIAP